MFVWSERVELRKPYRSYTIVYFLMFGDSLGGWVCFEVELASDELDWRLLDPELLNPKPISPNSETPKPALAPECLEEDPEDVAVRKANYNHLEGLGV